MRIELMPRIHQIPHRYQYSAIILLGQVTDFIVLAEHLFDQGIIGHYHKIPSVLHA